MGRPSFAEATEGQAIDLLHMENVFNQSIWGDEGFSAILSTKSIPDILKIISRDTSPPLWNLTEHLAFKIFGTGEVVIRSLSFLFFALAVFFVYKIGTLLWNKKTGIFAALLTFLNPFFFIYAFEGRMYSIMSLGVTASMYFFLKILKKEHRKWDKVGYVISTLWALYSHHFAIFALFIQGLWFLWEFFFGKNLPADRRGKRAILILKLFIAVGIGYLPWLYPLYTQTKMVTGGFWLGTPTIKDFFFMVKEYLAAGIRNEHLQVPLIKAELYNVAFLVILFVLILRKWSKNLKDALFLLSWFLGPIILTWLISQKLQSIFYNRYLLYTIPGAMLLVASNMRKYTVYLLIIVLIMFSIIDWNYFVNPVKLPFRQLSYYVLSTKKEGDILINWNSSAHHLWETKYYKIPAPIYIPSGGELPFFVGTALMEENDILREIPQKAQRVGVVTSGPVEEISLPGYTESEAIEYDRLKFIWYEKIN